MNPDRFDKLIDWLCLDDGEEITIEQVESELRKSGIDMDKAHARMKALIERYKPAGSEASMEKRNWTYSEGCGCRVTFFAESDYRTSRMLPGEECTAHTGQHQVAERDCLLERARQELAAYLQQMRCN